MQKWITTKFNKVNFSIQRLFSGCDKAKYIVSGATLIFALFATPAFGALLYSYTAWSGSGNNLFTGQDFTSMFENQEDGALYWDGNNDVGFVQSMSFLIGTYQSPTDEIGISVYSTTDGTSYGSLLASSLNTFGAGDTPYNWATLPATANPSCTAYVSGSGDFDLEDCQALTFVLDSAVDTGSPFMVVFTRTGSRDNNNTFYVQQRSTTNDTFNQGRTCKLDGTACITAGSGGSVITWFDSSGGGVANTQTRIISVSPVTGDSIASTSVVQYSVHAYINPNDVGARLSYSVFPINSYLGTGSLFGWLGGDTFDYGGGYVVSTTSGDLYFTSSSSVPLPVGSYSSVVDLKEWCLTVPLVGWTTCVSPLTNSSGTLIGTTTYWSVDSHSALGQQFISNIQALDDIIYGTATTTLFASSCNPLSFDTTKCVTGLFSASASFLWGLISPLFDMVLSAQPWGYGYRVAQIFFDDSVASSTLPSIAVSVPSGLPMGGRTIDFTPYDSIESALTKIDTTEVETITGSPLDKFLYYWNLMWYIMFGLWLVREIYQAFGDGDFEDVAWLGGDSHGRMRKDIRGRTYQEWSTGDIKRAIKKGQNSDTWARSRYKNR